jgi:macrolide-specific efflux system membrane fusion protein
MGVERVMFYENQKFESTSNDAAAKYFRQPILRGFKKTLSTIVLTMIAFNLTGCGIFPKEEEALAPPLVEPAEVKYEEYEVKRGNIEVTVKGYADFQSENLSNESFKYAVSYLKSVGVKTGDTVKTGQVLAEQETDSLKNDLKKKQLKLKSDQLNYDKTKNALDSAVDEKAKFDLNIQLEQQKIMIELDKIDIEEAQKSLDRSQLKSAIAGTVVYVDTINSGDKVTPNKTVVTVADPSKLQLRFSGNGMEKFFVGAKIDIEYDSKKYTGTVVADQVNIPKDASENAKKAVKIKLDTLPTNAKIGDTAGITLVLEKKENVIVIPQSLVHQMDGRNYVEMLENGLRVQRNVETGLKNVTEVEIVKGLNEGDKILE